MTQTYHCQALVLTCIDFRFHEQIVRLLKEQGITSFDLKCDAGAVKYLVSEEKPAARDWIIQNIEISQRLHHIEQVVLINHYDCGAYGGSVAFDSDESQFEYHREQLSAAKTRLASKFPELQIKTMFAKLDDGQVSLVEV